MQHFPPTIILRHRRENLKKCSLRGLEARNDMIFLTYPTSDLPDLKGYCVLALDAPELSQADAHLGLFLIDGTWRYAEKMAKSLPSPAPFVCRSLPSNIRTAYPRRQLDCPDPERGLASVEALFLAYLIMGRNTDGILDHYHWKDPFKAKLDILLKDTVR
jgi:pre-rRNA-processing protein TSR3